MDHSIPNHLINTSNNFTYPAYLLPPAPCHLFTLLWQLTSRYFCCLVIPGGAVLYGDGDIPQAFQFLVLHGECNTSLCSLKRVAFEQTSRANEFSEL